MIWQTLYFYLLQVFCDILPRFLLLDVACKRISRVNHSDKCIKSDMKIENYTEESEIVTPGDEKHSDDRRIVQQLERMTRAIHELTNVGENRTHDDSGTEGDWFIMACVLDRIFFIIYSIYLLTVFLSWIVVVE